ncbi:hypothetical protein AtubIFM57143_008619 [Aspergillus tubingensis]|nr:hypothetical protein AtubIFM57143_008619 [Aspergillus tubingensis]
MQSKIRAPKRISFLRAKPLQLSRPPSTTAPIPQHVLVDEELSPGYNPRHYYPAKPGEVLADHYRLLVKIGWGSGSTVWLARDVARHTERIVALKILNNNNAKGADHERRIEEHIAEQTPSHRGRPVIRSYLESFEFTDLKLGNVLITFENENILPIFVKEQEDTQSMQCKTDPETGRVIYRCHNNFGPLDPSGLGNIYPQITDFGAATLLDTGGDDGAVHPGTGYGGNLPPRSTPRGNDRPAWAPA